MAKKLRILKMFYSGSPYDKTGQGHVIYTVNCKDFLSISISTALTRYISN